MEHILQATFIYGKLLASRTFSKLPLFFFFFKERFFFFFFFFFNGIVLFADVDFTKRIFTDEVVLLFSVVNFGVQNWHSVPYFYRDLFFLSFFFFFNSVRVKIVNG